MNRCMGCGAVLQSEDEKKLGFLPKEKIKDAKLCSRCFRILHYNDLKMVDLPDTKDVIKEVNQKGKYAFFLVDFLNINIEVLQTFKEIKVPKTLIISKADFIPKYINKNNMKEWLHTFYGITDRVVFLSAVKNRNLSVIKETLKENNVTTGYLLGYTNAGKSTLINKVLEENVITTSLIPNTTVSYIKIDLEDGYHLIDTPGFQYENPIYKEDDIVFIKKMNPKTFIKPITFQLKKGASILIEDSIRIENKSEKCNLTFYMSNLLDLKKVYDKNAFLKEKDKKNFVLHKNQDIVFKGLGFINVKSDAEVAIYSDVSSVIEIRDSFLGVSSYE